MNTSWPPEITVAAVIERDNKFLLVEEESDGRIVLNQPAGHLDPGETLAAAAQRETLEETGWHFTPTKVIGIYLYQSKHSGTTYMRTCFSGELGQHNAGQPLDKGIIRALWLTRDEVIAQRDQLRSPMVLQCIDDYLARKSYPLELITDLRLLDISSKREAISNFDL